MKKITYLLIALVAFCWQSNAQFGCGSAVVITDGYTATGITTPGTGGAEDWNDNPTGTSISGSYWDDDVYLFEYTSGATAEEISMTINSNNTWNGIGIFDDCSGTAFSNELAANGSTGSGTRTVTATIAAGNTVYIAVGQWGTPNDLDFDVTAFTVTAISCPDPSALTATNILTTSADLGWSELGTASLWNVEVVEAGNAATGVATDVGVTNPFNKMGLTPATNYEFYVQSDCAGDGTSAWVGPFAFTTAELCPAPTVLTATNITASTADLGWTAGASETMWDIEIVDITAGDTVTGTATATGVGNPYSATGLTANNDYEFYVLADCDTDGTSIWVGPFAFTTACTTLTAPWTESFATNALPACFTESGDNAWEYGSSLTTPAGFAFYGAANVPDHTTGGGGTFIGMDGSDNGNGEVSVLVTPLVDVSSLTTPQLSYWVFSNNTDDAAQNILQVELYDGAAWNTLETIQANLGVNWVNYTTDLTTLTITGDVQMRFTVTGDNSAGGNTYYNDILIDDIELREAPSVAPDCPVVTATPDASCGNFATNVSWAAITGADGYNITIGTTSGGNDVEDNTDLSDATSYEFTGTVNTTYYYIVTAYNTVGSSTGCTEGSFTTAMNGCYCVPTSTSTNTTTLINDVITTGAIANISNTDTGLSTDRYGDFTATNAVTSFADGSFDFSVTTEGGTVGCAIWVDWNNDFNFDPLTEVIFNTTSYLSGPFTGTIAVPNGTANGDYRMRIMIDYNDSTPEDDSCAYNLGRGETEDYTITVADAPTDALDYNNLQFPGTATITVGDSQVVYAQAYEAGVTDQGNATAAAGIEAWIGYSTTDTDPSGAGWTWVAAVPNPGYDFTTNNNDEFQVDLGAEIATPGTFYYASRFRLNGAGFTYGGFDAGGGDGTWDGTQDVSGVLTINPIANDECSGAIALTVNSDYGCGVVTPGTTVGATASPEADDVSGTPNNDVWFTFTATNADHRVSLLNVVDAPGGPASIDMGIGVYDGTAGCGSLVFEDTSDPNTLNLTGLTIGTVYYVRVYGWSSSATFTAQTNFEVCVGTPPTCYEPTGLDASFAPPTSANLSWVAPTDGTAPSGYNWEVVPAGNGQGVGVISSGNTADLTATATGLTADTLYDFYVQSDCGGGDTSSWAGPFTFNAGYCIPTGTSTASYIDSFSTSNAQGVNISNLGSGITGNYENNFDTMTVSGAADGTFDFSVEIVGGTLGCAVWVDWNNDYVFDVSEVSYSTTSYGSGPFTGTVTIPNGTVNGDYRMRVMVDYSDSNPGNDAACSFEFGRGEVEDYKVTVDATLSNTSFEDEAAFTYYPNPVKNTLTLNAKTTIDSVTMYNVLGQEVLRAMPNTVDSVLDMSNLQNGAYFVKVTIANNTKTIRVIKQ